MKEIDKTDTYLEATGSLDIRFVTRNESDLGFKVRSKLMSDFPVRSGNDCEWMLILRYVPEKVPMINSIKFPFVRRFSRCCADIAFKQTYHSR